MKITDVVMREPVVISNDATIADAAILMASSGVGALLVTEHDQIVGIVTDRDIVTKSVARQVPADGRIDSIMTMDVVTLGPGAELEDAMRAFGHHAVRRIPIVEGTRALGVVSLDDILVAMVTNIADVAKVLEAQIMFPHARDEALPPVTA